MSAPATAKYLDRVRLPDGRMGTVVDVHAKGDDTKVGVLLDTGPRKMLLLELATLVRSAPVTGCRRCGDTTHPAPACRKD